MTTRMIAGHEGTPVGVHTPRDRVKMFRIGTGKAQFFKMWFKTRLKAGDGTDCGDFFRIIRCPVSPRHNGGAGVSFTASGTHYDDRAWQARGYKPESTLPKNWEEVNAKAQKAKLDRHRAIQTDPTMKEILEALKEQGSNSAQLIETLISERKHKRAS